MLRSFRGLCLICFCILAIAVIVALLELWALPTVLATTGCRDNSDMLPNIRCGEGLLPRLIEMTLNLPIMFFLAPAFTFFMNPRPAGPLNFILLIYLFDAILVLALIYPPLYLFARRRA